MLIHDVIKIFYTREGYLPDFPYHLISDEEMFEAFIYPLDDGADVQDCFFSEYYPCPPDMDTAYQTLVDAIRYHIRAYLDGQSGANSSSDYEDFPDWIYSYMINATVGPKSNERDRHDLFVLLDLDNNEDEFNSRIYNAIFNISRRWNYKLDQNDREHRPPTMFGEPHVIKSLRIDNY